MWFLIVLGVLVYLIIWGLIATEFYKAAEEKGYPHKKYMWITFFFGVVGMLLVIALPDRGKITVSEAVTANNHNVGGHAPQEISGAPQALISNAAEGSGSPEGKSPVEDRPLTANEWKCPKCGRINQNYVGTCGCGEERP